MRQIHLLLLILCSMSFSGCETIPKDNPRAQLRATQEVFKGVVKSLTLLRKAGKIDDETKIKIIVVIDTIDGNLKLWETAVKDGRSAPDLQKAINLSLSKLQEYQNLE